MSASARYTFLLLFFVCAVSRAQQTFVFSGQVSAKKNNQALAGVNLYDSSQSVNIVTDIDGRFSISLPAGEYHFEISYVGFTTFLFDLHLTANTEQQIQLIQENQLNEVTITSDRIKKTAEMSSSGIMTLNKSAISAMPQFAGESDLLKAVQQLPGVQSGYEGSRGLFVRGGSPDQNLVLFDNAPVYNSSHIYGFISIFAPDAIREVQLHKSYMPANYGGRLASALYIEPEFGTTNKLISDFSVGLITAKIHIQMPIKKDKTWFNFNVRECHAGLISNPLSEKLFTVDNKTGSLAYYFYDLNAALKHVINDRNSIQLSFYHSNDFYRFTRDDLYVDEKKFEREYRNRKLRWANYATTFSWNTRVGDIQVTNQVYNSVYDLEANQLIYNYRKQGNSQVDFKNIDYHSRSKIYDAGISSNWKKIWKNEHILQWGIRSGNRIYKINNVNINDKDSFDITIERDTLGNPNVSSSENYMYADYKFIFKTKFQFNAGLQGLWYYVQHHSFFGILPRFQFIYYPVKGLTLRTAFIQNKQNLHLLTGLTGDIENDLWVPATNTVKPESGWQYSAGMQYNLDKGYSFSADVFYRKMKDLVEYKYGYTFLLDYQPWESQLLSGGKGKSYGLELYAAKTRGQFTATFKYNLGWSKREFEKLNGGQPFWFKYDRRHDFSAILQYKLKKHFDFSVAWTYGSGNRLTIPTSKYASDYTIYYLYNQDDEPKTGSQGMGYIYGERNAYVLPAFHHLDIGMNYTTRGKRVTHTLNVSIYNVYNRFNVFTIYQDYKRQKDGSTTVRYVQVSLFPILPSVSYSIHFEK